jgi:DNA-binding NtrC family response regulator
MLFAKTEGRSLTLEDWMRQAPKTEPNPEGDLAHAAARLWRAIDQNGASFDAAFRELERRLLESALAEGGTRRQIANQLGMSERNLYHKLRAHGVHEPQSGADRKFSTAANSRRSPGALRQAV